MGEERCKELGSKGKYKQPAGPRKIKRKKGTEAREQVRSTPSSSAPRRLCLGPGSGGADAEACNCESPLTKPLRLRPEEEPSNPDVDFGPFASRHLIFNVVIQHRKTETIDMSLAPSAETGSSSMVDPIR